MYMHINVDGGGFMYVFVWEKQSSQSLTTVRESHLPWVLCTRSNNQDQILGSQPSFGYCTVIK